MPFITAAKVRRAFKQFGALKAPGPDSVRPVMVTKLPPAAIHYITFLDKAILKTGYTPKSWRMSNVIFIPKTGKQTIQMSPHFAPSR